MSHVSYLCLGLGRQSIESGGLPVVVYFETEEDEVRQTSLKGSLVVEPIEAIFRQISNHSELVLLCIYAG